MVKKGTQNFYEVTLKILRTWGGDAWGLGSGVEDLGGDEDDLGGCAESLGGIAEDLRCCAEGLGGVKYEAVVHHGLEQAELHICREGELGLEDQVQADLCGWS